MPFGDRLKHLLEAQNLSIAELSRMTGINRNTLYSYLRRNTQKPDPEVLKILSEVLNVDVYYFLGGDDAPESDGDPELWELREALRRRPEMRTLFSLSKNATAGEIKQTISIIEALRKTNEEADV